MTLAAYLLGGLVVILLIIVLILSIKLSNLKKQEPIGKLRVDSSDPDDGPYLFLELNQSIEAVKLRDKKRVILEVDDTNFISQK